MKKYKLHIEMDLENNNKPKVDIVVETEDEGIILSGAKEEIKKDKQ